MRASSSCLARLLGFGLLFGCGPAAPIEVDLRPQRGTPPSTPRDDVVEDVHGVRVEDPYRWLEDGHDDAVVTWADAQDAYARDTLERLDAVEPLRRKLRARWDREAIVVPVLERGGRYFYGKRLPGRDRTIWFVREGDGPERVLIDPDELGAPGSLTVQGIFPNPDGTRVAYRVSRGNADAATLRLRDVDTGRDLSDTIPGARFASPQWIPDGTAFFYTGVPDDPSIPDDELAGHATVRRHAVGTTVGDDRIELGPIGDPRTIVWPYLSDDGRWLVVHLAHGSSGPVDLHLRDLQRDGPFVPLLVGADARTSVVAEDGELYLLTSEGAPRYRVMKVDPRRPSRDDWVEVVRERNATLDRVAVLDGHLVLSYLDDVSPRVWVQSLSTGRGWEVELPEMGAVTGIWGHGEAREALLVYSSLAQRPMILRVPIPSPDLATASASAWYTPPADDTVAPMTMSRHFVRSADGTRVPMFVLHREDVVPDGARPTIMYGYGGFGISVPPSHTPVGELWAQRGGVWALVNLRGGGEYGERWHDAGRRDRKQNVFDDFIAAGEYLVTAGYTRPPQLGILGGSNGGLLVGAASTQRPDLFGAVVCRVPLLDMVRYHRFGVGPFWIDEYGAATDRAQTETLLAYSPYHRIRPGAAYPPLLMMAADGDDRVDPLHARKYVAAMQAATADPGPVLLRVERNAGHGGADSLRQTIDATAHLLAFFEHHLEPGRGGG